LHAQSHGESFLALAVHRLVGDGLYLMDEPEAALSPSRQLALLALLDNQVQRLGSQFVIATHSPILIADPDALIYQLSAEQGIQSVAYESTEHFQITRDFFSKRSRRILQSSVHGLTLFGSATMCRQATASRCPPSSAQSSLPVK